ncbi:MAG: 2-amino-4-hydroxy-6-hydroxymethyldihydropteridine pyrophosphokinae [Labilithrix sp.]|nr:2-amino-4-hydroxy-6-hydroxymethyldihydropteridine pyrophosphokinae [Labilithrix sp.]
MARVAIGLGANLGDRIATLREAASRIARIAPILARSHVWETAPVGGPEQPDYLNAALLMEWSREPVELLDALLQIEAELGRVRSVPNAPRTIDLDVLWIDGVILDEPTLVVPHPRLHARAFALAPMLEVAPTAIDPRTGLRFVVPDDPGVRRLAHEL